MSCEDCIHYNVCTELCTGIDMCLLMKDEYADRLCSNFKDKSKFIELPCKVGDKLYMPLKSLFNILCYNVLEISINEHGVYIIASLNGGCYPENFDISAIGKTIFLTEEEAKQAIKGE